MQRALGSREKTAREIALLRSALMGSALWCSAAVFCSLAPACVRESAAPPPQISPESNLRAQRTHPLNLAIDETLDNKMGEVYDGEDSARNFQANEAASQSERQIIAELKDDIRACSPGDGSGQDSERLLTVKLKLDEEGRVAEASPVPSKTTIEDPAGLACMMRTLRAEQFPAPKGSQTLRLSFKVPARSRG